MHFTGAMCFTGYSDMVLPIVGRCTKIMQQVNDS
jgi:hypothetical protein